MAKYICDATMVNSYITHTHARKHARTHADTRARVYILMEKIQSSFSFYIFADNLKKEFSTFTFFNLKMHFLLIKVRPSKFCFYFCFFFAFLLLLPPTNIRGQYQLITRKSFFFPSLPVARCRFSHLGSTIALRGQISATHARFRLLKRLF